MNTSHKTFNLGKYNAIIATAQDLHKKGQHEAAYNIIRSWDGLPEEAVMWLASQSKVPHDNGDKTVVNFIYPPLNESEPTTITA
jgi:hypothetical protein